MSRGCEKEIEEASVLLFDAFISKEVGLEQRALNLDRDVLDIVRRVGASMVTLVYSLLSEQVTEMVKADGLKVERQVEATVWTVLGRVRVLSPYLRNRATKQSCRPVKDVLGLSGRRRTHAVERALVDFGIEDSFELASQRFAEHYGHEVGRTTMLRVVESCAKEAEAYVDNRLKAERLAYDVPLIERNGADQILVELDGCMIRTGQLVASEESGTTAVPHLPQRCRDEA